MTTLQPAHGIDYGSWHRVRHRHWHRLIMCGIWFIEYEPPLNCLKDQRARAVSAPAIASEHQQEQRRQRQRQRVSAADYAGNL